MDNIFYWEDIHGDAFFECRKPYSKWTISSTNILRVVCYSSSSRKPYSKWTISSTILKL